MTKPLRIRDDWGMRKTVLLRLMMDEGWGRVKAASVEG